MKMMMILSYSRAYTSFSFYSDSYSCFYSCYRSEDAAKPVRCECGRVYLHCTTIAHKCEHV